MAEGAFQQHCIGDDLEAVGGPGGGLAVGRSGGLAALVLVGEVEAVAAAEAIDLAGQAQRGGGHLDGDGLAVAVRLEGGVQLPAGVDALVGDADCSTSSR